MTLEELKQEVYNSMEYDKPKSWREGQFVFNYIDKVYDVARDIQFSDGIDCFHNDDMIDTFLEHALKYINS